MKESANILTFHSVSNYGAFLQAHAMSIMLKKYYKNVEFLNYIPNKIAKSEKNIDTKNIKSIIDTLYSLRSYKKKKKSFKKMRDEMFIETKLVRKPENIEKLENVDLYLGSDQIWNFEITNGDESYFGIFANTRPNKINAYAASIGTSSIPDNKKEIYMSNLKKIDNISVREETAALLLKDFTEKKVEVVLDPTLLIKSEDWCKLYDLKDREDKYIFLYSLTRNDKAENAAKKLAQKYNLPIIEIAGKRKSLKKFDKHKTLYSASPKKFLELIKNAEFVVTDSFHATVFSIIFEKEFLTVKHDTRGSRIEDLTKKLGIEERYTDEVTEKIISKKINYTEVNKKLKKLKLESEKYIERCATDL